jgi:hypothetical protein
MAKKKAHELTTEQVLRRVFHKHVRAALKEIAEQPKPARKPVKSGIRKPMKGM